MSAEIHPTAVIEEGAEIGDGCVIGPYSIIRSHVKMGARNRVGPHAVVEGYTTLGDDNTIFQFASVGSIPQDLKYHGEPSRVIMGSKNAVREFVTIQPGTEGGGMETRIGDGNLFMANSHVGHDSIIGSNNVFANSAAIAGHVLIGDRVICGGLCGVHQFTRLGDYCLVSAAAMANKDVPPFCVVHGDRASLIGINRIGMRRAGYDSKTITRTGRVFRDLFWTKGSLKERCEAVLQQCEDFEPGRQMATFSIATKRGICPVRCRKEACDEE